MLNNINEKEQIIEDYANLYKQCLSNAKLIIGIKSDGTLTDNIFDWTDFDITYDKNDKLYSLNVESFVEFENISQIKDFYNIFKNKLTNWAKENCVEFNESKIQKCSRNFVSPKEYKDFITEKISADNLLNLIYEYLSRF